MSWNQGSTAATRLRDWLDPSNTSGQTMDGYDPNGTPIANFIADNTSICQGGSVTFTDQSSGAPTSWSWSFPGGSPSSYSGQTPPPISYASVGNYDVTLTVSNALGSDSETKTGYISVKNVVANFSGTPTTVVVGNTVTFTDLSSCDPTGWNWSFPGGTPSNATGAGPHIITYSTIGTYDVSLTVTKPGATDTKTSTGYISVISPDFNMTNGTVTTCTGNFYDSGGSAGNYTDNEDLTETFYPSTSGAMIRFNFTAFSTESGYDYLYIYNGINTSAPLIGTYNGTTGPGIVTANNASGALTFRFTSDGSVTSTGWTASITCYSSTLPPVANFSASLVTPAVGQSVVFTDLSANSPTSWLWAFTPGTITYVNGTSSTSQNPEVVFNATGSYDVSLTATNAYGSDNETKAAYITVGAGNYNMTNGTVTTCSGNFYDSGGPSGNYTNNENFTMTFYPATSGNMMRFVFSSFTSESGYDYLRIYDGENTSAPLIGTYNGTTGPGTVTANNVLGALTFNWTSDVSIVYAGWAATISCYNSAAPPVANFTASSTAPPISSTVTFTDATTNAPTSWLWSFNPSTITYTNGTSSTSQNPQVIFNELGLYDVTLTATNVYGSDSETKLDYINVINCSYCAAGGSNGTEEWIGNFTCNTINNSSSVGTGYTDYTAISTTVTPGSVYPVSVSCASIGSWTEHIWVFVDWNQDCDMVDAGESTDLGQVTGPGTLTGNITVPANAVAGPTRIRVMLKYNGDPTPCEAYSYGETEDYTANVASQSVSVDITAFLEGPFVGTSMTQGLIGFVPLSQPYNVAPWNYTGTESVVTIPDHAIDWVLIELRDAASAGVAGSATRVGRQAAFLRNDGRVIGLTGSPVLDFGAITITNSLFAVVHHRNHVSVISSVGLTQTGGVYTYNFSTGSGQAYGGTEAHKQVGVGVWGMFAGDGDRNGSIGASDESPIWEDNAGTQGYQFSDYNLDSQSNNKDKDSYWVPNIGKGTQVPN
jgi:PKD repeat protein